MKRLALILALLLLAPACAPKSVRPPVDPAQVRAEVYRQKQGRETNTKTQRSRLSRVSDKIMQAVIPLCKKKRLVHDMGAGLRKASPLNHVAARYAEIMNVVPRWEFWDVDPEGAAHEAGLRDGDGLASYNGKPAPSDPDELEDWTRDFANTVNSGQTVSVGYLRDGAQHQAVIKPGSKAYFPVRLELNPKPEAWTDGQEIVLTSGMLDFVQSDEELAFVVGHETAHAALGHVRSKLGNTFLGVLLDGVIYGLTGVQANIFQQVGSVAYSHQFEAEADYVGLYLVARAGFEIEEAPKFWRRMAKIHPEHIEHGSATHPSSAQRFVALDATVREIQLKKSQGRELLPEMGD